MAFGKALRKFGHTFWIRWQESSAVMFGLPVQLDPKDTGDKFQLSPVIDETSVHVHQTITRQTSVHKSGFLL